MTNTVYKGAYLPIVAGDSGVWGTELNTITLPVFDSNLGGYVAKALTNANISLSAAEDQNALLRLTGALSGAVQVTSAAQGFKIVENLTTNAFAVTMYNGVGTPVTLPQGYVSIVILDATNGARLAGVMTLAQLTTILTGTFALLSNAQVNAAILARTSQAITASGASLAINCALGMEVDLTLSANVTSVSVTNWPAAGTEGVLTIHSTSTGSFNISGWPGTTRWPYGVAPTMTASGRDSVVLTGTDGGSTFRGFLAGQQIA